MKRHKISKNIGLLALCIMALLPQSPTIAGSGQFEALVDYVIDGDSLRVRADEREVDVRLWGIDAPEYDQPGSKEAKKELQNLVLGKKVTIYPKYRDKYNRLIAIVHQEELNVNENLIESGHSWVHVYYCREVICDHWKVLQDEARKKGKGLWRYENPVPPWRWKAIR